MNEERTIQAVEVPDGIEPGTMIFAIRFLGEKSSMHGKGFIRIQEMMEWAEEIWTDMDSRIMFDSKNMVGAIYATIDGKEEIVAAIHAMIPQADNSIDNPLEV
jgi:hypothetical protein